MPFLWWPWSTLRASDDVRRAALATKPIESLESIDDAITVVAAGKETPGALPLTTRLFEGALYSSKGRGYASYNEDAALLLADTAGRMYAGVFDQAGGLGGTVRGDASKTGVDFLFRALKRTIGRRLETMADVAESAFEAVHWELLRRHEGEVTTAVAAVVGGTEAYLLNSGDSGALLFDKDGKLKDRTRMHEYSSPLQMGCLTHALGLIPEGPGTDRYHWKLEVGDWIVLCSDGLLDAGLDGAEVGAFLVQAGSAEDVLNRLSMRVLRMMSLLRAKPDNLSIVVVRVVSGR